MANTEKIRGVGLKIGGYKSFIEPSGIEDIKGLNLLIGRNNSGKSALLDAIEFLVNPTESFGSHQSSNKDPQVDVTRKITSEEVRTTFSPSQGNGLPGARMNFDYGSRFIDNDFTVGYRYVPHQNNGPYYAKLFVDAGVEYHKDHQEVKRLLDRLASQSQDPFRGLFLRRLVADRNIEPEAYTRETNLNRDGKGATNLIYNFLNHSSKNHDVIEGKLLKALNEIFAPQSKFDRIQTKILANDHNEVFLSESGKGQVALSSSGSGLKTVMLMLLTTIAIPALENRGIDNYLFIFEELENNLHPAIQRNLLRYLKELVKNDGCIVFLSTHSNVMIDAVSTSEDSQIIHVTHDGKKSLTRIANTSIDNNGILDDLDARASDILQANCVIWVEGPSDITYVKRWLNIIAPDKFSEGLDYTFMFYGGRLLSHLELGDNEAKKAVDLISLNRKAIIVIDSDRDYATQRLNATKKRIIEEVGKVGGLCWVTKGREIENYLSMSVFRKSIGRRVSEIGQFEEFYDYIKHRDDALKSMFVRSKSLFAEKIASSISEKEDLSILDLEDRVKELANFIKKCNSTKE